MPLSRLQRVLPLLALTLAACHWLLPYQSAGGDARSAGDSLVDGALADSAAAVCGNGTREASEQCDDGNTVNLDGCSAGCRFEQVHRVTQVELQFSADSNCPKNAVGSAFTFFGQTFVPPVLASVISSGTFNLLIQFLDLDDLAGQNDPALNLGLLDGAPRAGPGYSGAIDLDWWYDVAAGTVDAARLPLNRFPATLAARTLSMKGRLAISGVGVKLPGPVTLSRAELSVKLGVSSTPSLSQTGGPPGHLSSERLDPALSSFATAGVTEAGWLCSGISAASLKAISIPSPLDSAICKGFTTANTLLDLLVNGCMLDGQSPSSFVTATQPDGEDPDAPAAGAGPPYTLVSTGVATTGCQDKDGATVDLDACLADATYSVYVKFATGRVIAK